MTLEEQLHIASLGAGKPIHLIDIDGIQKAANQQRAELDAKNQSTRKSEPQKELDRLVQKHFDLKQDCRHFELQVNEASGMLHHCEDRIKKTKRLLAQTESPLGKANYSNVLHRMEATKHTDCLNRLHRERRNNANAVAALEKFEAEQLPRIEELRKEIKK